MAYWLCMPRFTIVHLSTFSATRPPRGRCATKTRKHHFVRCAHIARRMQRMRFIKIGLSNFPSNLDGGTIRLLSSGANRQAALASVRPPRALTSHPWLGPTPAMCDAQMADKQHNMFSHITRKWLMHKWKTPLTINTRPACT